TEFEPKQLPSVKHLPIVLIPPSVEAVGFIASWYLVIGNKEGLQGTQDGFGFGIPCQICTIWCLEEPSSVLCPASVTVIFDGKHAVLGGTSPCIMIGIHRVAMGTEASIAIGGPRVRKLHITRLTHTRVVPISGFG